MFNYVLEELRVGNLINKLYNTYYRVLPLVGLSIQSDLRFDDVRVSSKNSIISRGNLAHNFTYQKCISCRSLAHSDQVGIMYYFLRAIDTTISLQFHEKSTALL